MIFRKWGGGGGKGRLELFQKFIRFGRVILPLSLLPFLKLSETFWKNSHNQLCLLPFPTLAKSSAPGQAQARPNRKLLRRIIRTYLSISVHYWHNISHLHSLITSHPKEYLQYSAHGCVHCFSWEVSNKNPGLSLLIFPKSTIYDSYNMSYIEYMSSLIPTDSAK